MAQRCIHILIALHTSCFVPAACQVSAHIASDASARLLRKESTEELTSSFVEANISAHNRLGKSRVQPLALFNNNDFERCTLTQLENGHVRETFQLSDGAQNCPGTATDDCLQWTCSGPGVRMVPGGVVECGNLAALSGGVHMCLEQKTGKISQTVADHEIGKHYKVGLFLVGFQGLVTEADGTVVPRACIDRDTEDGLELEKHCCVAVELDGTEIYRSEDIFTTYSGEMVYYQATQDSHTISFRHCGEQADSVICIDDTSLQECGTDDVGDPDCQR